jgi:superfamily II DNA or RNA helicase
MQVQDIIEKTILQPREYQERIVQKVTDMFMGRYHDMRGVLKDPYKSIMIESPTGSGKTSMALLVCKMMSEELADSEKPLMVVWVAMRRNLLSQATLENEEKAIHVPNIHFISMFEKEPACLADRDKYQVLLVVDESQHDAASSMVHLHTIIKPEFVLGMTATPFRTDRAKLCFDSIVKDAGIHQLIQAGYLAKYHHYTIDEWSVENVARHYLMEPDRWGKSVVYFLTHVECLRFAGMLRNGGIPIEVVTGSSDVETQLSSFRKGDTKVLVNCMKLTEGFNDPTLKTAFVRDSGKGTTIQMAGRAFRKFPNVEFKQVVQSKDTDWVMHKTAMPAAQYQWADGGWRSLMVNERIEEISSICKEAIANTVVKLPKFIREERKKNIFRG